MSIPAASKKAKINRATSYKYYSKYFKVQNPDTPTPSHITSLKHYTQEQIKDLLGYIIDDKMTLQAASRKVNINLTTAGRYYRQYLKDSNIEHPVKRKTYTQDQINELIGYNVDDKKPIKAASIKANMPYITAYKFLQRYLKQHDLEIWTSKYARPNR
jgi:hypothetical protein